MLMASAMACAAKPTPVLPISGLIAWWTLNEGGVSTAGTIVHDFSGNNFNGYLTNSPSNSGTPIWTNAIIGQGLDPGPNKSIVYIGTNYPPILNLESNQFTVCAWVKPNNYAVNFSTIIACDDGNINSGWLLWQTNTTGTYELLVVRLVSNFHLIFPNAASLAPSNQWQFIAFGLSNNPVVNLGSAAGSFSYFNGNYASPAMSTIGSGLSMDGSKNPMRLMYSPFKNNCRSCVDDIRLYNRVLQKWELDAIYNSGIGRAEP